MSDEQTMLDLLKQAGSALHFHVGDAPQNVPSAGAVATPTLRVPSSRSRWGTDDTGAPIEPPASGLVFDPETGTAGIPEPEPETEPRASRAAPEKPPEKPSAGR